MYRFVLLSLISVILLLPAALAFSPGFAFGKTKVRGVNIGGWLVTEPWITPSLYDATNNPAVIDEWTFCQLQDRNAASAALKKHWDTWITESDFQQIAAAGLNSVRIPIGYWAFEVGPGEPYIQGQLPYLTTAIGWAKKYRLKVIVDLHGAPGSQNGFDNSGQHMSFPQWQANQTNINRSNVIIKKLATMFRDQTSTVPFIAPLNEPAGFDGDAVLQAVRQYWLDSYGSIRYPFGNSKQSNTVELIHDAFQPLSYWSGFMTYPQFEGVAIDTHIYQMFSDAGNHMTPDQHISDICSRASALATFDLWVIVGEWTPAPNDCARYLNGRGVGARYDGTKSGSSRVGSCLGLTGKASSFSSSYKVQLRKMFEVQVQTFEKGQGWVQWTWKTEDADEWSYKAGLANGWIPQNPTNFKYPNICGH